MNTDTTTFKFDDSTLHSIRTLYESDLVYRMIASPGRFDNDEWLVFKSPVAIGRFVVRCLHLTKIHELVAQGKRLSATISAMLTSA